MIQKRRWVIGSAADCDLVVNHADVSPRHCFLVQTPRGFVLEDQQSQAGTFVNGVRVPFRVRVTPTDRVTLGPGVPMPWPRWAQEPGETVIHVGRAPDNDVVLDYPVVSPYHARVILAGNQARIEDLDSAHGTALGSPEHKITRARLAPDDVVWFGWFCLPAAQLLAKAPGPGGRECPTVTFRGATLTFGQDAGCEQVLRHPTVSQWHARLTRSPAGLVLEDLASAHGTFVNGQRVHGAARVRPGDVIGLGGCTFRLADGGRFQFATTGQATVRARAVTVEVHGNRLLEKVSLTVLPGELVGIMGPSGAGKTMLLTALNGYTRPTSGDVLLNGKDLYAHYRSACTHLGYVPQDDIIHRDLTVGQALTYSARLRLPGLTRTQIAERVGMVIRQLGLEGTEAVLIGSPEQRGISGGQRKRVNLALELLTDPLVLFLDEPTTGLSSEEALAVLRLLRDLADAGTTVIVTIHQPSLEAFRLLDNLAVVARDATTTDPGRLAYYGPAYPDAVHFFNPDAACARAEPSADAVLRGLAQRRTQEWVEQYAASGYHREYVRERGERPPSGAGLPESRPGPLAGLSQWWTLVRRGLALKVKNPLHTLILLAQAPVIALLVVLVYGKQVAEPVTDANWGSVANALAKTLFLLVLAALWFGCSNAIREIVGEWAVYRRERMVTLKIPWYVAAKFTVLGGLCLVQCAVSTGIAYWGCGLKAPWWPLFGVLLLASLAGVAVGLLVSALARTTESAISLLPIILLFMVILGGVMHPIHNLHESLQVASHGMPSRWAFEGMLLLESEQRPTYTPPRLPPELAPPAASPEPQDMAEYYFPRDGHRFGVATSSLALAGMVVALVLALHIVLKLRDVH